MTREEITRMAREAGFVGFDGDNGSLRRFAALVAAAERNRTWTQEHWTEYERSIAAAEREACAKVCEEPGWNAANWCAKKIRERNN